MEPLTWIRTGAKVIGTVKRIKDKDWRSIYDNMSWTTKGIIAASVVAIAAFMLVLIMAVAAMAAASSAVTSVVDRVPGGAWFTGGMLRASGNPDLADSSREISPEDAAELRAAFDEDPALMECLSSAPPVTMEAVSLYIANDTEKQEIIAFQESLRQEYIERENERRRVAAENGRPVRNSSRPEDPSASLPPYLGRVPAGVVPDGADRGRVRDDLSPSAFINPGLISTFPSVVPAGQQIREGNRMTSAVNLAIDEVPTGTHVGAAQTYLLVAFAGGVTDWAHFSKVVTAMGYENIPPDRSVEVASRFFGHDVDFAPYIRAVNASVISLAADEVITGSVANASKAFMDCKG